MNPSKVSPCPLHLFLHNMDNILGNWFLQRGWIRRRTQNKLEPRSKFQNHTTSSPDFPLLKPQRHLSEQLWVSLVSCVSRPRSMAGTWCMSPHQGRAPVPWVLLRHTVSCQGPREEAQAEPPGARAPWSWEGAEPWGGGASHFGAPALSLSSPHLWLHSC